VNAIHVMDVIDLMSMYHKRQSNKSLIYSYLYADSGVYINHVFYSVFWSLLHARFCCVSLNGIAGMNVDKMD